MKILNPEARIFLPRLIEEMDNIVNFTMGMTLDEYKLDTKTRYAVEHAIAIASEAAGNIKKNDPQAVKKFSEFPFKELTDQRINGTFPFTNTGRSMMLSFGLPPLRT